MKTANESLKCNTKNPISSERTGRRGEDSHPETPGDSHPDNLATPQDGPGIPSFYLIDYENGWRIKPGSWLIGSWTDFWL